MPERNAKVLGNCQNDILGDGTFWRRVRRVARKYGIETATQALKVSDEGDGIQVAILSSNRGAGRELKALAAGVVLDALLYKHERIAIPIEDVPEGLLQLHNGPKEEAQAFRIYELRPNDDPNEFKKNAEAGMRDIKKLEDLRRTLSDENRLIRDYL